MILGVPEASPALVHDLGHALGREIVGLLADDGEDVALPALQLGVFHEEEENILLGLFRELPHLFELFLDPFALDLEVVRRVDEPFPCRTWP